MTDTPQLRQKRRQVARACDECRIHRAKCDASRPCSNCKNKGRQCSNSDATRASTLSQAYKEIDHLRQKVQDLEAKLEQECRINASNPDQNLPTPSSWYASSPQISQSGSSEPEHGSSKKKFWQGIQLRPARSPHITWFGPSSQYYFIKRLSVYLTSSLQQNHSADHMLPKAESSKKLLDQPGTADEDSHDRRFPPLTEEENITEAFLSPIQEEYFVNLFWQSYHTSLFAILDEAEFKKHHQSLWIPSSNSRKSSALVDIVLAMCMQYHISTLPASKQGNDSDATIAGRRYYRRCQKLLTYELESPTISTLQCHLLCTIYLCGGSFHNMVDSSCGLAVRTAYMLGLHSEPPKTMPLQEQEHRRRLWWAVYLLDSKTNMKLGRPFSLPDTHVMPHLPSDNLEAAMLSGSTFAPLGDNATWLSFNLHQATLYKVVRVVYTAFYSKDFDLGDGQTIWDDSQALEAGAEVLKSHEKQLREWVQGVPDALKTKRQNNGRSLSVDNSALEIEQFAPLWLQRQRLLLELTYHNLCLNLYRPCISLVSIPVSGLVEGVAVTCAAHAIAYTNIAHQVLSSTSILDGWHEVFQWQWKYANSSYPLQVLLKSNVISVPTLENHHTVPSFTHVLSCLGCFADFDSAAMTLVGFVLTYPQGSTSPAARNGINLSVSVFEIFGNSFAVAANAAKIVRDLCTKVDFLMGQSQTRQQQEGISQHRLSVPNLGAADEQALAVTESNFSVMDMNSSVTGDVALYGMMDGSNQDLFDMAVAVDFWADIDMLWPTAEQPLQENWILAQ